jgi:restriction endonuclease Mrr
VRPGRLNTWADPAITAWTASSGRTRLAWTRFTCRPSGTRPRTRSDGPEIQGFVGALHGAQANRGVFITTSNFTNEAITYADRVAARVVLIDGITLAQLMVTHNIGVQDRKTYVIKRVDEDFFEET